MVNNEQLGLGRVELIEQFVDGEGGVGGGNSTEPVRSPGGGGELDVVGSEESNAVIVADVPASLRDHRYEFGSPQGGSSC